MKLLLIGCYILLASFLGQAQAAEDASQRQLRQTTDLQALGQEASEAGVPILLLVSQQHCGYCTLIKHELLQPMELSGEYRKRVLIREILMDPGEHLQDFQGNRVATADFAHRRGVDLTPTMLFLGPDGSELHQRILGVPTIELLPWYVDAAIDQSRIALAKTARARDQVPGKVPSEGRTDSKSVRDDSRT